MIETCVEDTKKGAVSLIKTTRTKPWRRCTQNIDEMRNDACSMEREGTKSEGWKGRWQFGSDAQESNPRPGGTAAYRPPSDGQWQTTGKSAGKEQKRTPGERHARRSQTACVW